MAVRNRSARQRLVLAASLVGALQSVSLGGVTFLDTSTARWTFDPDSSGGTDSKVLVVNPPPNSSGMPGPPSYQLSKTFTSGASNSTARGSIGFVANNTTATFTLAAGTGVTQTDPNNTNYKGDSVLRVGFDGVFQATSPSFGPPATGYVSIGVGGTVGAGGKAQFIGNVNFVNNSNVNLRPAVNFNQTFSTAGNFAQVFTSSALLNPQTIANGTQFHVKGFFEFRASNHVKPSNIVPLDIDIGSAPPTATWYGNNGGNWSGAGNWAPPAGSVIDDPLPDNDGSIIISTNSFGNRPNRSRPTGPTLPPGPAIADVNGSRPVTPNNIGDRARFSSFVTGTKTITLNTDVTLGALDLNAAGNLNFTGSNTKLILDTFGDNASIIARNVQGGKNATFNTPVVLNDTLDIVSDSTYIPGDTSDPKSQAIFNKKITGNNNSGINKFGNGNAAFNTLNDYTGGTYIGAGKLAANAQGSLGSGYVEVNDAQLDYNARHAAASGVTVFGYNGAQVDFGVVPATDERFELGRFSAISGNAAVLSNITVEPAFEGEGEGLTAGDTSTNRSGYHGGNKPPQQSGSPTIALAYQAMIGHEEWNTGARGNPKNLGNDPRYIFGISADFNHSGFPHGLTIGSESNSPWLGFGSDRTERTFGNNPSANRNVITVKGWGNIVALNETLWLNAKLSSAGTAELYKEGKGTVSIENYRNDFKGTIDVYDGLLQVNGNLPDASVRVHYGAGVGGRGYIGGLVEVNDNGYVSPGSNKTSHRVGRLKVGGLALSDTTLLNFDLGRPGVVGSGINDLLEIEGDLVLDGILNITDTGDFGPGTYTLMEFDGALVDNTVQFGSLPNDTVSYAVSILGNSVLLNVVQLTPAELAVLATNAVAPVPEPGAACLVFAVAALALRRRRKVVEA